MTAPTRRQMDRAITAVPDTVDQIRVVSGFSGTKQPARRKNPNPLGQVLLDRGHVAAGNLVKALAQQTRQESRLGEILLAQNWVTERDLLVSVADQWGIEIADLVEHPPDVALIDRIGVSRCLSLGFVPWKRVGSEILVATSQPDRFEAYRPEVEERLGAPARLVLANDRDISQAIATCCSGPLAKMAEKHVPEHLSCRQWSSGPFAPALVMALAALAMAAFVAPMIVFFVLFAWALFTLALGTGLKGAALVLALRRRREAQPGLFTTRRTTGPTIARLPVVSMMVPLFHEAEIAGRLLKRLGRVSYPPDLMDVLLVVEETDTTTRTALARTRLPHWARVVTVPEGGVQTKPRALNYALDFCRGSIVGIWDAEDAPAPDQLHQVVRRFHERGAHVACLQGILDFYNARTNWLSRCFTIEYASWFRVLLPGLQHMGLPIPLGGTTLFFRRAALEGLGRWDAHNVTEDADLGIRLARAGYRTEMLRTVTAEEANCRVVPWIKQRSRWLKGYAMTWAVHMRRPAQLWRDLGPRGFLGFQVLFVATLSQFILAPLLWTCWLIPLGFGHPIATLDVPIIGLGAFALFIACEAVNLSVALMGLRDSKRLAMWPWVPSLHLYFPLAALAGYKALIEVISCPFYWDKTTHGLHAEETEAGDPCTPEQL